MTIGSFLEKKKIREFITEYDMLKRGDGVVLGLSGGPDSVCLFYVLLKLREELELNLAAVHVNHMIRGKDSDEDQAFVEALCDKYNVPLEILKEDIPALAAKSGRSLEEEARIVRYDIFEKVAVELEKIGIPRVRIAIAHNANDNAETVMFHMARGAGLDGMCGIAPVRERIIRPLLQVGKEDILDWLEENDLSYCVDATNSDTNYSRNRIRHMVIPELCQVNTKALEHISEMTKRLQEVQEYLDIEAKGLLCMAKEGENRLRKKTILTAPRVLQQHAIKMYLSQFMPDEKDVSLVHIEAAIDLLNQDGEKQLNLPHGKKLIVSYEELFVVDDELEEGFSGEFNFREFPMEEGLSYPRDTYTKWFDCDKITDNIEIRTRAEGDYLTINSDGGRKLLQDYFIDEKIPKHLRDSVPLVCDGKHVLWVVGHRISEYYKISNETTHILEVKYMEEND